MFHTGGILKTTQNPLYLTQQPWNIGKNYGFNPYFYFLHQNE